MKNPTEKKANHQGKARTSRRAASTKTNAAHEKSYKALIEQIGGEALPDDLIKKTGTKAKTWKELIVRNAFRQALKSPQFFHALRPQRKGKPRGKAFAPGNEWRFPQGASPNPGGRPKRLGESLAKLLEMEDQESGKPVAELLAERMIEDAINGSAADRREIRLATEGETVHTPDMLQVFIDR